jgi:muconolactone delta-isomerase
MLRRKGKLLSLQMTPAESREGDWRCFLVIRERSVNLVQQLCEALPLAAYLSFEITVLDTARAL